MRTPVLTLVVLAALSGALAAQAPTEMKVARIAANGSVTAQSQGFGLAPVLIGVADYKLYTDGSPATMLPQADGVVIPNVNDSQGGDASYRGDLYWPGGDVTVKTIAGGNGNAARDWSMAFFPFSAGWQGAYVWQSGGFAHSTLPAGSTATLVSTGKYVVDIAGVDSATDGMLFVVGDLTGNRRTTTAPLPGGGWRVATRTPTGYVNSHFGLIYVPFSTHALIGGQVNANGVVGVSSGAFTLTQVIDPFTGPIPGAFHLTIPGVTSPDDGILMGEIFEQAGTGTRRGQFSYYFDDAQDRFVLVFQQDSTVTAFDFVFAFVPTYQPWTLTPSPYLGTYEDLDLDTGVNGAPDSTPVKDVAFGDQVTMLFQSGGGTFDGLPWFIAGQFFTTGAPPTSPMGFPEIHLSPLASPAPFVVLSDLSLPYGLSTLGPGGISLTVPITVPLSGSSLMLQGISLAPTAANGVLATTDGHELRFL